MSIETVYCKEEKAQIVRTILNDLPEWFGLPESTEAYIQKCKDFPLLVSKEKSENLGFISLKETSQDTCELYCMGIRKEHHRKGIGKKLYNAFENLAQEQYEYVQVKTVESGHYKEYDQTVHFYKSVGFKALEVFPTLWDKHNPCLIMIKKI